MNSCNDPSRSCLGVSSGIFFFRLPWIPARKTPGSRQIDALEQGGDSVAGFNYQAAQDRAGEVEAELETARPSDDGGLADAQVDEADVGEEAERETP